MDKIPKDFASIKDTYYAAVMFGGHTVLPQFRNKINNKNSLYLWSKMLIFSSKNIWVFKKK